MDVYRTLTRFPPNISDGHRRVLQDELTPLIVRVLWEDDSYNYYQGFHDVCLTALLVMGDSAKALPLCRALAARGPFGAYLTGTLEQTALAEIQLVYVLLKQTDPELEYYSRRAQLGSLFALSWPLTWFAHSLDSYESVVRLYDFFLASLGSSREDHLAPVYLAASLVLYRSADVLANCECDMAPIHSLLTKIPEKIPLEALIADVQDLQLQFPPDQLRGPLLEAYNEDVARNPRDESGFGRRWDKGRGKALTNGAFQLLFWAGTAGAAAWYLYMRYGIREASWMQFL